MDGAIGVRFTIGAVGESRQSRTKQKMEREVDQWRSTLWCESERSPPVEMRFLEEQEAEKVKAKE